MPRWVRQLIFLAVLVLGVIVLNRALEKTVPLVQFYPHQGYATWYTARETATGEKLDDSSLTCAARRRDFGKYYQVCNQANGRCVVVRHNNWGPCWILFAQGRIVDLTKAAFSQLADLEKGIIKVRVDEIKFTLPDSATPFAPGTFIPDKRSFP